MNRDLAIFRIFNHEFIWYTFKSAFYPPIPLTRSQVSFILFIAISLNILSILISKWLSYCRGTWTAPCLVQSAFSHSTVCFWVLLLAASSVDFSDNPVCVLLFNKQRFFFFFLEGMGLVSSLRLLYYSFFLNLFLQYFLGYMFSPCSVVWRWDFFRWNNP